jgi:RNA binding exosome subunit
MLWIVISAVPSFLGYLSGLMDFRTAVIIYITEPIKEIIHVLKRIRKGRFDEKVQVVSNDEIGYTGDVINVFHQPC